MGGRRGADVGEKRMSRTWSQVEALGECNPSQASASSFLLSSAFSLFSTPATRAEHQSVA